jgi:glycosyltransferase involved in cell wall biosynthesis
LHRFARVSRPVSDFPLVSIVIPAYNHARFVDEAIQSVLAQDYPNKELIVLDDGSKDDTAAVLRKYEGLFHFETHSNIGQAATLNKGWRMARGVLLSYLSADDALLPGAVSSAVAHLRSSPDVVLVYPDFNLVDKTGRTLRAVSAPEPDHLRMLSNCICAPGPGVFFRREGFEATGGWNVELRQMPDFDYWLRLGLHGRFQRIPEVLASFRVHEESQTFAKSDERRCDEPIRIITRFYEANPLSPALTSVRREALASAHLLAAQLHFRAGRFRTGLNRLVNGVQAHPRLLVSSRPLRAVGHGLLSRVFYQSLSTARSMLSVGHRK